MKYQMQNFIDTMGELCEFSFLDGPLKEVEEQPIKFFVDRGVEAPFKRWVINKYKAWSFDVKITKAQTNYEHFTETIDYIVDYMNRQEEPFDGYAGFSQGFYSIQAVLQAKRHFPKRISLRHRLPFFCIDFNGLLPQWLTYELFDARFINSEVFIPNCASLHFVSENDPMSPVGKNFRNYEKPIIVHHTQGHRPVKNLPEKELHQAANFVARQF